MKTIKLSPLRTANREVASVEKIERLFVCMGNSGARAWIGLLENLAVDVLSGTSFIDGCILEIIPSKR